MRAAASELEYERAARLRDRLTTVRKAIEQQQMVAERNEDLDVVGIAEDDLEAAVQVFFVRKGRVVGRKGFVVDKVEDLTPGELVGDVLEDLYDDPPQGVPKTVLVPAEPDDLELYEEWLVELRGSRVEVRVPQRGAKRELQETVTRNASEEFTRHRLRRASDHNSRARALNELQDALGLPEAPLRIECYDMSHIQGTDYVGSMVVVEDGLPEEVRLPPVQGPQGAGQRRLRGHGGGAHPAPHRLPRRAARPVAERPGRFAYPPQLLLVDGGKGQLDVAVRVLEELGLDEEIPVASLAKRFEEVYVPGRADPIRIARQSEALYLLQRIRDEAHRFAITYHRELRGKRMTKCVLDDIPGLGETRRKRLMKEMGGVGAVQAASLEDLGRCHGCPTRWPRRCTTRSTASGWGGGAEVSRGAGEPAVSERDEPLDLVGVWEQHAAWWQSGFTGGADVEYDEQILPMAARHLAGAAGSSTSAAARGRSPGWRWPAAPAWSWASTPPTPRSARQERRGGGRVRAGRGHPPAGGIGLVRRRGGVPGARAPRGPRRRSRRGGTGRPSGRPLRGVREPPVVPDAGQRLGRRPGPRPA